MAEPQRSVVIHGHFYQPPRENPWLEMLEAQLSAAPRHDWNERVERECYRAVTSARVLGAQGRISEIQNSLRYISFNFGPTLLEWMARHARRTYGAILEADRRSQSLTGGHGNAIAQPYHHTILPLASWREKVTEVRWGIEAFRQRFRREPVGMWLPETAADGETLEVLAREGMAFTILAPHQVKSPPAGGRPGLFRVKGGPSIAVFVYDGPLSHGVAFGSLLKDAEQWAARMLGTAGVSPSEDLGTQPEDEARLVAIATDGETYGHHHRFGEMALAAVLNRLRESGRVRLENFAGFLSRTPAAETVELVEPSSWSCVHGVERWRAACGCKMDPSKPTQQVWRTHLRAAMEGLAEGLHQVYLEEAPPLLGDPLAARDDYARVLTEEPEAVASFVQSRAPRRLDPEERTRAAELLEMERNALRLFTSCGWFFDDLAGIEPLQVLRYGSRAMELAGPRGESLREAFLERMAKARTNEDPPRDGRTLYLQEVEPTVPVHLAVGAGAAALDAVSRQDEAVFAERPDSDVVPGYRTTIPGPGRVQVVHRRTGRTWNLAYEVLWPETGRIEVRIWQEGREDEHVFFGAQDLPETFRDLVREGLQRDILSRWAPELLFADHTERNGGFSSLVSRILVDAVQALDRNQGDDALARVGDLAHLLTLLGLPIPFDAQTDFFHILQASSPEEQRRLEALREPLGFVLPS